MLGIIEWLTVIYSYYRISSLKRVAIDGLPV